MKTRNLITSFKEFNHPINESSFHTISNDDILSDIFIKSIINGDAVTHFL